MDIVATVPGIRWEAANRGSVLTGLTAATPSLYEGLRRNIASYLRVTSP